MKQDFYENEKIQELLRKQKESTDYYDNEIRKEREILKSQYKFSWKRFLLFIGLIILIISMIELNHRIFSKDSIWSWDYYFNK